LSSDVKIHSGPLWSPSNRAVIGWRGRPSIAGQAQHHGAVGLQGLPELGGEIGFLGHAGFLHFSGTNEA
jgi:hypothetical protein